MLERLLTAAEESVDLEVYSEEVKEATNMVSDGVSKSLSQLLNIQNTVVTKFLDFALGLLLALVVFFVGLKLIRAVTKAVDKGFQKRNMDLTLQRFLLPLITYTLRILLAIIVISMLGLPVSSLVALLGAAGVAIGLALQGGLSNFAGGILILFVKPFKVGVTLRSVRSTRRERWKRSGSSTPLFEPLTTRESSFPMGTCPVPALRITPHFPREGWIWFLLSPTVRILITFDLS